MSCSLVRSDREYKFMININVRVNEYEYAIRLYCIRMNDDRPGTRHMCHAQAHANSIARMPNNNRMWHISFIFQFTATVSCLANA